MSVIYTSLRRIHILAFGPGVVAHVVGRTKWKSVELSLPVKIANREQCLTVGGNPRVKGPHQNLKDAGMGIGWHTHLTHWFALC